MFNVAVIKLKDLIRYLLIITIIISASILLLKNKRINIGNLASFNINKYAKVAIEQEIPQAREINDIQHIEEKNDENLKTNILETILKLELGFINIKDENKNKDNEITVHKNEIAKKIDTKKESDLELAKTNLKTEVVTKNPLADTYTDKYKGVKIKNETSFDLTDDILDYKNLKINKSNIIIFHTHTCESYTSSEKYSYIPTGKYRSTDLKFSVARVGDELNKYLEKYKINVIHNKTYHDYPSYTGSYTRSLSTVLGILKNNNADIIIDLHRDAIGSDSSYAPTVKIGEDYCAQLMFVMGSNGGGLNHPNWKNNLQFAIKMQEKANKIYPGLFKPIILRNSRYNQHLGKAACIIEVGSTGNTLEQALNSIKYLAEIINEI